MTRGARITQADMERALKSVVAAGIERARIIMDLENTRIDIVIGETDPPISEHEEWSDDDV